MIRFNDLATFQQRVKTFCSSAWRAWILILHLGLFPLFGFEGNRDRLFQIEVVCYRSEHTLDSSNDLCIVLRLCHTCHSFGRKDVCVFCFFSLDMHRINCCVYTLGLCLIVGRQSSAKCGKGWFTSREDTLAQIHGVILLQVYLICKAWEISSVRVTPNWWSMEDLVWVPYVAHFPLGRVTVYPHSNLAFRSLIKVLKFLWRACKAITFWPVLIRPSIWRKSDTGEVLSRIVHLAEFGTQDLINWHVLLNIYNRITSLRSVPAMSLTSFKDTTIYRVLQSEQ